CFVVCLAGCLLAGGNARAAEYAGDDLGYLDYVTLNGNSFENLHSREVVFYTEDLDDGKVEIRGILESQQKKIKVADLKVQISVDGGKSWTDAKGDARWSFMFEPKVDAQYQLSVRVVRKMIVAGGGVADHSFTPMSGTTDEGSVTPIMTHVPEGTVKPLDPKNLVRAPAVQGLPVSPHFEQGAVYPIVAHLEVTLDDNGIDGNSRWSVGIRNLDPQNALAPDRYELKVVQVLDIPGQTVLAGIVPFIAVPHLSVGEYHGFGSGYEKNVRAQKLRAEVWDRLAKTIVAQKDLAFLVIGENPSAHALNDADPALFEPPQLLIEAGVYRGRGAWQLQLRTNNMMFPTNHFSYTYTYKMANGNEWQFDTPKDIAFPISRSPKILLEAASFYDSEATDCAGLQQVDIEILNKDTAETTIFTIPVRIPHIEDYMNGPVTQNGLAPDGTYPIYWRGVVNQSYYNLLLGYSLVLSVRNTTDGHQTVERRTVTGTLMLPARHTRETIILVHDVYAIFPELQSQWDALTRPENGEDWSDRYVHSFIELSGQLTVEMPATPLCGQGRPLLWKENRMIVGKGGYLR
ncbi:MAG: hypothetical protein PF495_15020, partial [Spirochaetales bacterium]|nr:hypothetical protein [Spirochaetales bacterium]